jgi:hypothetical protein
MLLIRTGKSGQRLDATVTADEAVLSPHLAVLEPDHPYRRWMACLVVFAQHVLASRIDGAYSLQRAELFARHALLPDDEFCQFLHLPDALLAEHFNVPLPQIAEKREDLRALLVF